MSIFEKIMLTIQNYAKENNKGLQDYKAYVRNNKTAIISMLRKTPEFHEPAVATRTILIAYAFEAGLSLGELQKLLVEYKCETLYTRNIEDYCLIYAFNHQKSYEEWIPLVENAQALREGAADGTCFKDGITVPNLRNYIASVRDFSEDPSGRSKDITLNLKRSVLENQTDEDFTAAVISNISEFVGNRETARRKLIGEILNTIDYCQKENWPIPWISESERQTVICKRLIDALNFTFPGLISNKGGANDCRNFRSLLQTYAEHEYDDPIEAIGNHLKRVIKGSADINRLLFVLLLAFLQADFEERKSVQDINDILLACGWTPLDPTSKIDNFVINVIVDPKNADEYMGYVYQDQGSQRPVINIVGPRSTTTRGENFAKAIKTLTDEHKE